MAQERENPARPADQRQAPTADPTAGNQAGNPSLTGAGAAEPALPPPTGQPACGPRCVDITGHAPEGVRIDPDITEGHPGYEESGDSELIPPDRLAEKARGGEGQGG